MHRHNKTLAGRQAQSQWLWAQWCTDVSATWCCLRRMWKTQEAKGIRLCGVSWPKGRGRCYVRSRPHHGWRSGDPGGHGHVHRHVFGTDRRCQSDLGLCAYCFTSRL